MIHTRPMSVRLLNRDAASISDRELRGINRSRSVRLFFLVLLLVATCFYSSCQHSYGKLPTELQSRISAEPAGGIGVVLHELAGLPSPPSSIATTTSAIYAVVDHQVWLYENKGSGWENISLDRKPMEYVEAVSASTDGHTLYEMSWAGLTRREENANPSLLVVQSEQYRRGIPDEFIVSMASNRISVSDDGQTVYVDSSYPEVRSNREEKVKTGSIGRDDLTPVREIWAWKNGKTYALWSSGKEGEDFGWHPTDPLEQLPFGTYFPDSISLGPDGVFLARQYTLVNESGEGGDLYLKVFRWTIETGWQDYSDGLDARFAPSSFGVSAVGGDIWVSDAINWAYWRNKKGSWTRLPHSLASKSINSLFIDPHDPAVAYLGTGHGLYWTIDNNTWSLARVEGEAQNDATAGELKVALVTDHPGWQVPIVVTNKGVYFATISKEPNRLAAYWGGARMVYRNNSTSLVFWLVNLVGLYLLGIVALLFLAWRGGSTVFARTALISLASKPLLLAPGLGRWALFLGYTHRLPKLPPNKERGYFGLPANDSRGSVILPDSTGATLHERICSELQPQRPVLVIGKGGAGKSTLLAQWALLALKGKLSRSLKGYRPILVSASYYGDSLIEAIADTLRERDGVAVDAKIMRAQLQSGRFLILFDGVSEVARNTNDSLKEILKTARNADYKRCRFLIATRPLVGISTEAYILHLQPLTSAVISMLLPRYNLSRERESRIRRQLESFGEKPIEPLLFSMALAQSASEQVSDNRAQLYERYFRRLLKLESDSDDIHWEGWRTVLEACADRFMLTTGKRGVGLPYRQLVETITGRANGQQISDDLVDVLRRDFHLPASDEIDVLQRLRAAGLLHSGRRWRFAHDSYEEYFAASFLVTHLEAKGQWPDLKRWLKAPRHEQEDFFETLEFINDMIDHQARQQLMKLKLPTAWQIRLQETTKQTSIKPQQPSVDRQ